MGYGIFGQKITGIRDIKTPPNGASQNFVLCGSQVITNFHFKKAENRLIRQFRVYRLPNLTLTTLVLHGDPSDQSIESRYSRNCSIQLQKQSCRPPPLLNYNVRSRARTAVHIVHVINKLINVSAPLSFTCTCHFKSTAFSWKLCEEIFFCFVQQHGDSANQLYLILKILSSFCLR